jgi:MFS family permease
MTDTVRRRRAHTPHELVLTEATVNTATTGASAPRAVEPRTVQTGLPTASLVVLGSVPLLSGIISVAYLPALPAIARSYHASPALLAWTVSVASLVGAAAHPISGRLGDLYGRRRVMLSLVALFTAGSVCLAGLHSDAALLLGRGAQAAIVAAAPLAVALVTELVGRERRAQVLPLIVAITGAGFGLGFLGGATVVEHLGLRAMADGLAGLGAVMFVAVLVIVRTPPQVHRPGRVDWIGALLLCAPIGMLVLVLGQVSSWGWSSTQVITFLIAIPILLTLFAIRQATAREPLIPHELLARREVPVTYALAVLVGLGLVSLYILLPELLEGSRVTGGFGLAPTGAGFVLAVASSASFLGGLVGRAVIPRLGVTVTIALAMLTACLGYGALALGRPTLPATVAPSMVAFLGFSVSIAAVTYGIAQAAPAPTVGTALSLSQTAFAIGTAIGAQLSATVVTQVGAVDGLPTRDAYTAGFVLAAGLSLVASLAAYGVHARRRASSKGCAASTTAPVS